jgi:fatty-acid desaturase
MKTPVNILLTAIAYWLVLYATTLVPLISKNYYLNLVWMTVMIPNIIRFAIGNIPRLAVDRIFFLSATFIALIATFIINQISSETKEAITDHKVDTNKKLKLSALLAGTFTIGVLATYYSGIDNSIYSNMGWERPV